MGLEDKVRDVNILKRTKLPPPKAIVERVGIEIDDSIREFVFQSREQIKDILIGNDKRLMMIIGPCSIHSVEQGINYAQRLQPLAQEVNDKILVVMRTYFEKPRTTIGWPGMVYDPGMNGQGGMENGIMLSRNLLRDVIRLKLPVAAEFAGVLTPQYYGDLISYAVIGARTSESRDHRGLASGLSMPVGLKNGTCGSLKKAIDAVVAARHSQIFLGVNYEDGLPEEQITKGNMYSHMILRGGENGANYRALSVNKALDMQTKAGVDIGIVIDASHANSKKDPFKQPGIVYNVIGQRSKGNNKIVGVMVESNLTSDESKTDPGLPWEDTKDMILRAYELL